jgi:hypothetical protein
MPKPIVTPPTGTLREQINEQRGELFKAQAVANCVRHAITSKDDGLQETDITFALRVTAETIDAVAAELERIGVAAGWAQLGAPYQSPGGAP